MTAAESHAVFERLDALETAVRRLEAAVRETVLLAGHHEGQTHFRALRPAAAAVFDLERGA